MASPLSESAPWDHVAPRYNDTSRHFLRLFVECGLQQLDLRPQMRALDIACGPGTAALLLAPQVHEVVAADFSPQMLEFLRQNLQAEQVGNVAVLHADGQDLPLWNGEFDVAVSFFGLMFFPDRQRGFAELHRVLAPGGQAVVSSWAPLAQSSALVALFAAMANADPSRTLPPPDPTSLENPEVLAAELVAAGFVDVRVEPCRQMLEVTDVAEFWRGMVDGNAMLQWVKGRTDPALWLEREQLALAWLRQNLAVPAQVDSLAWLGFGRKAG